MGCDIHMYVEKKVNGEWQPVKGPNIHYGKYAWENEKHVLKWAYRGGRNYDLFALLADVRNDGYIEPISDPKGLPFDISDLIDDESSRWGIDGHSHSYFTLSELKEIVPDKRLAPTEFFKITIPMLGELAKGKSDDVRIVFWFDN